MNCITADGKNHGNHLTIVSDKPGMRTCVRCWKDVKHDEEKEKTRRGKALKI
jgi:hypothetical protein